MSKEKLLEKLPNRAKDPHDQASGMMKSLNRSHLANMNSPHKFNNFVIRNLKEQDIPASIDIANNQLGKDYVSADLLKESLGKDSPYFTKVAVVQHTNGWLRNLNKTIRRKSVEKASYDSTSRSNLVVGFCLNATFTKKELNEYINVEINKLPDSIQASDEVSVIRTIAVKETYKNQGIGTDLVDSSVQHCHSNNSNVICSIGWKDEGSVSIGGVLERLDFNRIHEYKEYWHEDSIEQGYNCETCGEPPCNCSAVLYARYQ